VPGGALRDEALRRGVLLEYVDATGRPRTVSRRALAAVVETLAPPTEDGPVFVRPGGRLPPGVTAIAVEGGGEAAPRRGRLDPGVPIGYHGLRFQDGSARPLIVSPGACVLPPDLRTWGWATQLYACRSGRSWGIGDAGDLARLARWSRGLGAGLMLLNPLGAARPGLPQQASPYFASSRRFRDPLYVDIARLPGAAAAARFARRGRALNDTGLIDRDAVYPLKLRALEAAWKAAPRSRAFDRFVARGGEALRDYGVFNALAERFGSGWRAWPEPYRHPRAPAVARYAAGPGRRRVEFHAWVQWQLDRQLATAARALPLMHDLAVGFDPEGADAWAFQDLLAPGVSLGAPPDALNLDGQDWGLPPFDPGRLRAAAYRPMAQTLAANMAHGGIRVDHVLGFFRMWWVPQGLRPDDGAYVRCRAAELLDVLAIESHRAAAVVVGEDLGTVEAGVREELARRRVLSYRLLWFEGTPPRRWPRRAMAAVTTHDLATVAGTWTGADVRAEQAAGKRVDPVAAAGLRERLAEVTGAREDTPIQDVVARAYEALAAAPSHVLTATLEDAAASVRRPNMPGTIDSWPNWRIPLPVTLERLTRAPLPRRIAAALGRRRR